MAWLKKFIDYSKEIDIYTGLCTCPAHTEFQTAVIFHSVKKLKLDKEILKQINSNNPVAPTGIEFRNLKENIKNTIFEDLTNELSELDIKFVSSAKNLLILKHLMRLFHHYGDIVKFETDILYTPISKTFHENKSSVTSG